MFLFYFVIVGDDCHFLNTEKQGAGAAVGVGMLRGVGDPVLPNSHFMFSGRYCSRIRDFLKIFTSRHLLGISGPRLLQNVQTLCFPIF